MSFTQICEHLQCLTLAMAGEELLVGLEAVGIFGTVAMCVYPGVHACVCVSEFVCSRWCNVPFSQHHPACAPTVLSPSSQLAAGRIHAAAAAMLWAKESSKWDEMKHENPAVQRLRACTWRNIGGKTCVASKLKQKRGEKEQVSLWVKYHIKYTQHSQTSAEPDIWRSINESRITEQHCLCNKCARNKWSSANSLENSEVHREANFLAEKQFKGKITFY